MYLPAIPLVFADTSLPIHVYISVTYYDILSLLYCVWKSMYSVTIYLLVSMKLKNNLH